MKKYIITLILAGLALALTGANAQETPTLNERIATYWNDRENADWGSLEADNIADEILALQDISELNIVQAGYFLVGARADENPSKMYDATRVPVAVKNWWSTMPEGSHFHTKAILWFDEDLSLLGENYRVWDVFSYGIIGGNYTFAELAPYIAGEGLAHWKYNQAFKAYRATLPKDQQIALTQTEKDGLVAVANRNAQQDQWLTEISADLMALTLDQ